LAFSSSGSKQRQAFTLYNLGDVYEALGEKENALEAYNDALSIQEDSGDKSAAANTLNEIGKLYASQGKTEEAKKTYQQALELLPTTQEGLIGQVKILNNLGNLYASSQKNKEAFETYMKALRLAQSLQNRTARQNWETETLRNAIKVVPTDKCSSTSNTIKQFQSSLSR
jgi:tetratricopeptide (TPR) repeat protein